MSESHPSNLKGLLRFLLEYTKNEDAQSSTYKEMDPERRKFLEAALSSMTTDVIKEFEKAISILDDPTSEVSDKVWALNTIRERIDDLDFANSFVKAGGSGYLIELLTNSNCELKCLAAYIIAEMSQNNPFCQKYFVDSKTIPKLINFLNESSDVARSGLHAISSLIQDFEPALTEFVKLDGIRIILTCLDTTDSKLYTRACALIGKLSEHRVLRDELVEKSAIAQLVASLPETFVEYDTGLEQALYVISRLSESSNWVVNEEQAEKLKNLNCSIMENQISSEYEEICDYAAKIVKKIDGHL